MTPVYMLNPEHFDCLQNPEHFDCPPLRAHLDASGALADYV
jgi:hypothetical protein